MQLTITQQDCDKGTPGSHDRCAMSQAIIRQCKAEPYICGGVHIGNDSYMVTEEVIEIIREYDRHGTIPNLPVTIELEKIPSLFESPGLLSLKSIVP